MTYMDEKHEKIKCLTEELEKARFEAAMQADRADCLEKKNEELRIGIENTQRAVEEVRRQLAYWSPPEKHGTGRKLQYSTEHNPMAGSHWFDRAMADHRDDVLKEAQDAANRGSYP